MALIPFKPRLTHLEEQARAQFSFETVRELNVIGEESELPEQFRC